jgi:subtilase family serine protease
MQKVISRKRWIALCAVVLAMAATMVSQTLGPNPLQRPNRITQQITSGALVTIAGSVHPQTQRATDLGEVNSGMQMDSLTMNIGMSAAEQTELDALLAAQQDPTSPQYHQWLTQEEYGARFGLTDADLNSVSGWLTSQGFTIKGVAKSRNAIYFGGKAWQVESAFHTQLHQYKLNDEMHFANATEIRVPAALGNVLLNVRGLNSFRLKPQLHKRAVPSYTVNTTSGIMNFLTPADWATIYDVNNIYTAGYTGKGAYVGVVGQTYAPQSDITNFRSAAGMSTPSFPSINTCPASNGSALCYVCIDSTVSRCTGSSAISTLGDRGEADLDIEWAGGIAKDATVVYVYAPFSDACTNPTASTPCTRSVSDPLSTAPAPFNSYGVFDALQRAVQDYTIPGTGTPGKVLPVISMSYTECEATVNASYVTWVMQIGNQANSQGQTLVVASGDTGVAGCDLQSETTAYQGLYVTVPANSSSYTGVGGTTLSGDESNPPLYWNQTLNLLDSALGYIPETVWNDTSVANGLSTSGGGVSLYNTLPKWQPNLGLAMRMVPDVAFAASPYHDAYLTCSADNNSTKIGTDCASGFVSSNGYFDEVGGTSAATPSFAGMLTLLVQMQGTGIGLGNINPKLYGYATTNPSVFHDITSGNSLEPCSWQNNGCVDYSTAPPPYTQAGFYAGYSANKTGGYNLATGLGSVDGYQLYLALGGTPSAPGTGTTGTGTGTAPATYTLSSGLAAVAIADASSTTVTLTLSPSNYTGAVTLTATSNSANVVASLSSTSVQLAGGVQSSTLTLTTTTSAEKHTPTRPWKSGGGVLFAVLLGVPFTLRQKRRALAMLLVALMIASAGFLVACGGGGSSSSTKAQATPRTYLVTVTATGAGTVVNPLPVTITVTVP